MIGLKDTPVRGPRVGPICVDRVEIHPRAGPICVYWVGLYLRVKPSYMTDTLYFRELTKLCAYSFMVMVSGTSSSKGRVELDCSGSTHVSETI